MQKLLSILSAWCRSLRVDFSKTLANVAVAVLAITLSPTVFAQITPESEVPSYEEITIPTSFIVHIDDNAVIRDVATGAVTTPDQVQAKIVQGIVIGVIIGAGSGAVSAAISGGNWGQVVSAGLIGGAAGYYGGIAALTTGVSRIMHGTYSVFYGGGVTSLVGSASQSGGCATQTNTCVMRTR
jgi:hypothetical protein